MKLQETTGCYGIIAGNNRKLQLYYGKDLLPLNRNPLSRNVITSKILFPIMSNGHYAEFDLMATKLPIISKIFSH